MLKQRIVTAIVLSVLVTAGILWLPTRFFEVLVIICGILAVGEMAFLFWRKSLLMRIELVALVLLLFTLVRVISPYYILVVAVLWWLVVPYFLWQYTKLRHSEFNDDVWRMLIGVLVFVPFMLSLIVLRRTFGPYYLLYGLVVVWLTDIGAFFVGKYWGKRLLAPAISPKKTVEGLVGGLVLAMLVAGIFKGTSLLMLTLVVCLWSVIGDLFESMLKRQMGVKDSGKLLPGHGGIYDRIDSLTAALPIFTLGLLLLRPKIY